MGPKRKRGPKVTGSAPTSAVDLVQTRLRTADRLELQRRAEAEGTTVSAVARAIIQAALAAEREDELKKIVEDYLAAEK
jgi:hypothetical protein